MKDSVPALMAFSCSDHPEGDDPYCFLCETVREFREAAREIQSLRQEVDALKKLRESMACLQNGAPDDAH